MSRFLVYRSLARYDALGCFADQLVAALRGLGHDAELLVFSGDDLGPRLTEALGRRPAAVIAFNGLGVELEILNDRLYTRLGLPYLGINVDHPVYLLERLRVPLGRYLATFVDHSHVAFAGRFFPGLRPSFLPHAATLPAGPGPEKRDLGIVFAGSYEEPGPIADEWRTFKPATAALFEETAARCLATPEVGLYEHFEAAFTERGLPAALMTKPEVMPLLSLPDRYVRACWRKDLLMAFDRAGLVVDVVGHNWQAFAGATGHRFHPPVAFDALPAFLQRANVVLHAGANFPTGSHERVLTAMACGAVACADHTAFYASSFAIGRDLLTYRQGHFDELAETVRDLLQAPERLAELQRCGPAAIAAGHTWAARARSVMELVG